MTRVIDVVTGSILNVSDETVTALGAMVKPMPEAKPEAKPATPATTTAKAEPAKASS